MRLVIVMPVLEEEGTVEAAVAGARRHCDEVIVVDGGSRDRTVALARRAGATVTTATRPGRGQQLRTGAAVALEGGADALLFLHADTRLPSSAREEIEQALAGKAVGGGFLVDFEAAPPLLRLGRRLVDLRTKRWRMPLGDQAQFAAAEAYVRSGGFADLPILEDLDFMRRLGRQGPISIIPRRVTTSSRRFIERGVVRTVATNWLIWLLFAAGVKPVRLARLYVLVR